MDAYDSPIEPRSRRPVMVFAGDFRAGSTERGLADGFRTLGWIVHEVDRRSFGAIGGRSLLARGAARLLRKQVDSAFRHEILQACAALSPDIFFTVKGAGLTAELLDGVGATGAKAVMYYPDYSFNQYGIHESAFDLYRLFITTKSFQVQWLRSRLGEERVAYVSHGYVDAVHQSIFSCVSEKAYQADVLYAGNHSAYKQDWLARLVDQMPGIDLKIAGNRWLHQSPRIAIPESAILGEVNNAYYSKMIQLSRINIAVHMGPTISSWYDLVSTRTFEIPA